MPYAYGMQGSPVVGSGLGGIPKRKSAESREPLIYEVLGKQRGTATVVSFEIPSGYSRMRITLVGRGADNGSGSTYGGGKAISGVLAATAGNKIDINLTMSTSTVSYGALSMSATNGFTSPGTASGGETNLSGTIYGAGGITDPNSTEMGSKPGTETNNQAPPGGSSPGAPGGNQALSGGGLVANPGGQPMVRIVLW